MLVKLAGGAARIGAALAALALHGQAAADSDYPNRPIEMVIPFTPGGATDIVARSMQARMSQILGQPIVIINKPGAATNIGTMQVVRARPDGYTVLIGGRNLTTNEALFSGLEYAPMTDLEPVTMTTNASVMLVVNPSLPVRTVAEFVDYVKARPGVVNYASYGAGSTPHLAAEIFQKRTGVRMTHVPYSGNGPASLATLRNETQVLFTTATSVAEALKDKRLRALAQDGARRSRNYPDIPTFAESGIDFAIGSWFGLLVPKNTPRDVIAKLNDAARQALNDPEVKERLAAQGWDVVADSPAQFKAFLLDERRELTSIIKEAGITVE
ncbi:tripartite tricarboxylate transporter substrate binding protein [Pigmentiphaga soli]|uniref:Tripartite tricarboxylate transporter substrate binding protein n=1 Tax=Pigmentiphaga soli TaxID=1007095 RepID=A0ABP8HNI0_9BURK